MALHLETILLDQGVEADTQGSYAATNGVLFVLCTSALIFTGVVLMLHAST
jgi:hypothetical protein